MKIIFFLSLVYFISACNTKNLSVEDHEFKRLSSDSMLLQNLSSKTMVLNLLPIDNGVDSFELRIWHGFSISTPKELVTLKYQDANWQLTHTDYWFSYQWVNGSPDKIFLDSTFTKSLKVPPNISSIIDSIYQFRLDTFPSQNEIPGFQDKVADGIFYQIELATCKFYKAIQYNNPSRYEDTYSQQMTRLIIMLNSIGVFSIP